MFFDWVFLINRFLTNRWLRIYNILIRCYIVFLYIYLNFVIFWCLLYEFVIYLVWLIIYIIIDYNSAFQIISFGINLVMLLFLFLILFEIEVLKENRTFLVLLLNNVYLFREWHLTESSFRLFFVTLFISCEALVLEYNLFILFLNWIEDSMTLRTTLQIIVIILAQSHEKYEICTLTLLRLTNDLSIKHSCNLLRYV